MLEEFSDIEIDDLLSIGYLHHRDGRQIETKATYDLNENIVGSYIQFRPAEFGGRLSRYRNLKELLFCEYLSFDDLRKEWMYYGTLLGNKTFCDKLVHDPPYCPCGICTDRLTQG